MAVGYGPQASSSLSPQLNTLSSANSSNGARSLGTSSLTDTGLIASYPSSSFNFPSSWLGPPPRVRWGIHNKRPFNFPSSWLGPPPVSVGGYTTSVPYGVPTSSSSSTGSRQSPQMLPHYPTGGMPPPSAFSSAQPMTGRAAEKARQQQYNPYRKSMATTNTPRLPPVSNALATQFASASAGVGGLERGRYPVPQYAHRPRGCADSRQRRRAIFIRPPSQRRKIQSDCSRPSGRWTTRITIRAWQR